MNRFKTTYIATAASVMFTLMRVLAASAEDAKAGPRFRPVPGAPGTQHYYRQATGSAPYSRQRTTQVRVGAGDIEGNHIITSRRASILPYMEQGNLYRRP